MKSGQKNFPLKILLVGSGNLLLYLFRNTHMTKSKFLFLRTTNDVCDRHLLGPFVSFHCMHACMQLALLRLLRYSIQGPSQRYSHAGAHTTGVRLRCCSPCAVPRSAASSVPAVGAERSVEQAQNLQAKKLVWPATSSQCHILR